MFKNNVLKKVSIAVASLALILPLASVNNVSVSAKTRKPKVVKIVKRHVHKHAHKLVAQKMDDNGNVKGHHYYKFAYNRKEYRKAVKYITLHNNGVAKLDRRFCSHKSKAFHSGFNDSLNNTQNKHYLNTKQYEQGYLIADAYTINGKVTKKAINDGKSWFKTFKKMGPGTGPAIEQMKWEAHIDTL